MGRSVTYLSKQPLKPRLEAQVRKRKPYCREDLENDWYEWRVIDHSICINRLSDANSKDAANVLCYGNSRLTTRYFLEHPITKEEAIELATDALNLELAKANYDAEWETV